LLALETSRPVTCQTTTAVLVSVHHPSFVRFPDNVWKRCPSGEIPDPNFRIVLIELGVIYVIEATSSTYSVTFWFSDFSGSHLCPPEENSGTDRPTVVLLVVGLTDPQERWVTRPSEGHDEDHDGPGRAAGRPPGRQDPCSSRHGSSSSRKVSSQSLAKQAPSRHERAGEASASLAEAPREGEMAPIRTTRTRDQHLASHSSAKLPRLSTPSCVVVLVLAAQCASMHHCEGTVDRFPSLHHNPPSAQH
jgi:hypothetical protein